MAPDPSERALQSNRKECHEARDVYFQCMISNNGQENKCRWELSDFKGKCPKSWVDHFIRKHKFEQFKKSVETEDLYELDKKHVQAPPI